MKNPKRPTRNQKILMKSKRLNPNNWLVMKNMEHQLIICNKEKGTQRVINK